jgi:hypothetical protein
MIEVTDGETLGHFVVCGFLSKVKTLPYILGIQRKLRRIIYEQGRGFESG